MYWSIYYYHEGHVESKKVGGHDFKMIVIITSPDVGTPPRTRIGTRANVRDSTASYTRP